MRFHIVLAAALLLGAALAGCANNTTTTPTSSGTTPATSTPTPGAGTNELTYVASQSAPPGPGAANITYKFDGPETAAPGWVTFTLQNKGFEPHQAGIWALGNVSYEEFSGGMMAMLGGDASGGNASGDQHPMMGDAGPHPVGGAQAALPGANTTGIVNLAAGTYAVICFIPGPGGMPHAAHGMMKKLVVSGTAKGVEPTGDITVTTKDYKFEWSKNLTAGHHVVKFTNAGTHHHEVVLFHTTGNATSADILAYFAPGNTPTGPPPTDFVGGGATLTPGLSEYFPIDVVKGHYAVLCFEQDDPNSPPHAVVGMVQDIDVA